MSSLRMLLFLFVEDFADSFVGSRSGSLYTAGADLRHEVMLRMIGGGQMVFVLGWMDQLVFSYWSRY